MKYSSAFFLLQSIESTIFAMIIGLSFGASVWVIIFIDLMFIFAKISALAVFKDYVSSHLQRKDAEVQ